MDTFYLYIYNDYELKSVSPEPLFKSSDPVSDCKSPSNPISFKSTASPVSDCKSVAEPPSDCKSPSNSKLCTVLATINVRTKSNVVSTDVGVTITLRFVPDISALTVNKLVFVYIVA